MKRKITELEQKLINDGWYLNLKRYSGKHSEKIECYEYEKTSDLRNDGKIYDYFIDLDQKRLQIVKYGIKNLYVEKMSEEELTFVRFLFLELRHFVERVLEQYNWAKCEIKEEKGVIIPIVVPNSEYDERQELEPMTFEQMDELCQEQEKVGK